MDSDAFTWCPTGDRFPHLFELHLLEKLLIGFKFPLGIGVILRIETVFDGFLAGFSLHRFGTFILAIERIIALVDDAFSTDHGCQRFSPFFDLVLLIADGLVESLKLAFPIRRIGCGFGRLRGVAGNGRAFGLFPLPDRHRRNQGCDYDC